ncbi:MAG: hypothetical protein HQ528_02860 [Candidatus Marinimicrobia bacterium]|nr:hypothetical protein [Candidatus Neomarinimicrobiota bacterium]
MSISSKKLKTIFHGFLPVYILLVLIKFAHIGIINSPALTLFILIAGVVGLFLSLFIGRLPVLLVFVIGISSFLLTHYYLSILGLTPLTIVLIIISIVAVFYLAGSLHFNYNQSNSSKENSHQLFLSGALISFIIIFMLPAAINLIIGYVIYISLFLEKLIPAIQTILPRKSVNKLSLTAVINRTNVLPFYISGIHFGLSQIAIFFTIQCFVTATFLGYFAVACAWLTGVVISLKFGKSGDYIKSLIVSIAGYILLAILTAYLPPYHIFLPIYFIIIILIALPAGSFFRNFAQNFSATSLFFHENNGFVLGFILSLLGFVKWGVYFLYSAPLVTFLMVILSQTRLNWTSILVIITFLSCSFFLRAQALFWLTGLILVLAFASALISPKIVLVSTQKGFLHSKRTIRLMLFIAGFNLILLQYFITREFSIIIAATEITVLIVGAAYFTGFSIGYGIARFINARLLKILAVLMFLLHVFVLLFSRFTAGYMIAAGYGMETLFALLFITALGTSSFYSIFLPKLIDEWSSESMASAYSWDLLGAFASTLAMFIFTLFIPSATHLVYFTFFLILIYLIFQKSRWRNPLLLAGIWIIGLIFLYGPDLYRLSTQDYYLTRDYENPDIKFSANSLYHTVDIIDTYQDTDQTIPLSRWSFLNGVVYFGYQYDESGAFVKETGLSEFTYFLAELPAKYLYQQKSSKLRVLILGCGSMYSIGRISPFSEKITMVEIDQTVVISAQQCWYELNRYDQWDNYELIIDDAKHYLSTTDENFDLIIMDISAPYQLGTMLLHNLDFYQAIQRHLKPNGIFAESTQGRPLPWYPNSQGMKILKGVTDIFPYYRVVDCTGWPRGKHGYIYASNDSQFSTPTLLNIMREDNTNKRVDIYSENDPYLDLQLPEPYSLTSMETLLSGNLWRLEDQLQLEDMERRDQKVNREKNNIFLRSLHFRLPNAILSKLKNPFFIIFNILVIIAAIGLRWQATYPRRRSIISKRD